MLFIYIMYHLCACISCAANGLSNVSHRITKARLCYINREIFAYFIFWIREKKKIFAILFFLIVAQMFVVSILNKNSNRLTNRQILSLYFFFLNVSNDEFFFLFFFRLYVINEETENDLAEINRISTTHGNWNVRSPFDKYQEFSFRFVFIFELIVYIYIFCCDTSFYIIFRLYNRK